MADPQGPKLIFHIVIIILAVVIAALIFIPNRYWVAASKWLVPPEKYAESTRPDPWG